MSAKIDRKTVIWLCVHIFRQWLQEGKTTHIYFILIDIDKAKQ